MNHTTTIQSELNKYLETNGISINQLSRLSTVNSGTLSALINGERLTSITQFDLVISAMGLPEGSLYKEFMDACFTHTVTWRRIGPFLRRCAELRKLDIVEEVVQTLLENLAYSPMLFELAEELFAEGDRETTAIIYKNVAEAEKYQHSERLALCHYRLFKIDLSHDQEQNLRAATRLEVFIDGLDPADQLDALKDLANTYLSLQKWRKVDEIAKEMRERASIQYELEYNKNIRSNNKKPKSPLFLYITYSYLLQSIVYEERGDYEQALEFVALSSELSWVKENTKEAAELKEKFKILAIMNTYLYRLLMGQTEVLSDYVIMIESREEEVLTALVKIVKASNMFKFNIDHILEKFKNMTSLEGIKETNQQTPYTHQVIEDRMVRLLNELSIYYLRQGRYDIGINYVLDCLSAANEIRNDKAILKSVKNFEAFRHVATTEAQHRYNNLISEVRL
ncbi:transcriptional regulator [Paenibacillus faecalis]|uniref:transcriptional regulator n=1 Tax=Paenibacillus faecalis TaxID=2079532 RepID=UPI000D100438|nr:transcriptional regulator [Paenibacillus faecalis]